MAERKQKTVDPDTLPAIVVAESEGAAEYITMLRRQRAELVGACKFIRAHECESTPCRQCYEAAKNAIEKQRG